jgi:hypothetical protein
MRTVIITLVTIIAGLGGTVGIMYLFSLPQ